MFLIHSAVISTTTKAVDLVMKNHSIADINRAVVRHFPVLDKEDVPTLRLCSGRKTHQSLVTVVLIENVVIAGVPRWNMQVCVRV